MMEEGSIGLYFQGDAKWNEERMAVEFTVAVRGDDSSRSILCRVSWEALIDAAQISDPEHGAIALEYYEALQQPVYFATKKKIEAGTFDADGSITIRSQDLRP